MQWSENWQRNFGAANPLRQRNGSGIAAEFSNIVSRMLFRTKKKAMNSLTESQ